MRICDVCYTVIEGEGEICEECKGRKPANELMEKGVSDEEIIRWFLELKGKRENNIEILTDELKRRSNIYEKI